MRVLVTESKPGAADAVRTDLSRHGHHVLVCHADGSDDFHCVATGSDSCPLDLGLVDVFVDVRDSDPQFTTREYGVVCARRADVPVVIAGPRLPSSAGAAYDAAALECTHDDVSEAVDSAAALPDVAALHALRVAVRAALVRRTGDDRGKVSLIDHGFYVDVVVRAPSSPDRSALLELEQVARSALRPYRRDWVHTRLVFRHTSGAT